MMTLITRGIVLVLLTGILTSSCSKRENPTAPSPGSNDTTHAGDSSHHDSTVAVQFSFRHTVNGAELELATGNYINEDGDSFSITDYRYYISNIKLYTADGSVYAEPESYHLVIEEENESKTFVIEDLPEGDYTKISFLIGVDSQRNTSGAQKGALDPVHGLFWNWNTGYVMARMEGKSSSVNGGLFSYHIGGFKGFYNVIKEINLKLPIAAKVRKGKKPVIHIQADIAEWFKTPTTINFSQLPFVGSEGADAATIADNYADMFSISSIEQ